jgi:hypothetical protein
MRSAAVRKVEERASPEGRGLKGRDPLSEPLDMGQFKAGVPLSGNALFTFRLLSGGLLTGSPPKALDKPEQQKKEEKKAEGTDVSQFEDRVMF